MQTGGKFNKKFSTYVRGRPRINNSQMLLVCSKPISYASDLNLPSLTRTTGESGFRSFSLSTISYSDSELNKFIKNNIFYKFQYAKGI